MICFEFASVTPNWNVFWLASQRQINHTFSSYDDTAQLAGWASITAIRTPIQTQNGFGDCFKNLNQITIL